EIPGLLSWMAFGDMNAHVRGLDAFPDSELPPLWLPFVSFHNMVALGSYFVLVMTIGAILIYRRKIEESKWYLKLLLYSIPLPLLAIQFGWIAAEVGRQPWAVYKILRTADAVSITVTAGEILFSIILFGIIYLILGALYLFLLSREVKHGPASSDKEVMA
ncbi:cytochrome ubiquinol oxidase subunit I, partial [bacterium]|nr:cytochrome ubiquinol oxidase subunit I [bacterium]